MAGGARAQPSESLGGFPARAMPAATHWPAPGHTRRGLTAERLAARELEDAREILGRGYLLEGRRRLEVLVARYPTSPASELARRELARLYASPVSATSGATTERATELSGGARQNTDNNGSRVPASLGTSLPTGDRTRAGGTWADEPRLVRAAEQDFRLSVGDRVFFSDQSADLGARARALLSRQANWLMQFSEARIVIEGHADDVGNAEFNQELALRRAQAVRDWLIGEGVEASRIAIVAHGNREPIALCADGTCAAHNRRAVTVLRGTQAATVGGPRPRPGDSRREAP